MFNIIQNLVPENLYPLKCTFWMSPDRLCIHNTANDAPAMNEARYVHNNPEATSYHYAVDDIQAVQILPLDRNGWHAGDGSLGTGNRKSIGIEICYSKSGGWRFEKAQENAAELSAKLMHDYGWGLDLSRITKHEDYANKHCPHRTLDDYGWDYFLSLIKEKYEELYEEEIPMTQEEKTAFDKLTATVGRLAKSNENAYIKLAEARKENEKLSKRCSKAEARLKIYDDMGVYDNAASRWAYIDGNIPGWAKETLDKLTKRDENGKAVLVGDSTRNSYDLCEIMIRMWVTLDRLKLLDFALLMKKLLGNEWCERFTKFIKKFITKED